MQCFFGADLRTFITQNTFRPVFPLSRFVADLHIHRADLLAFSTVHTFFFLAVNPQQGKIAHGLQKGRDRA